MRIAFISDLHGFLPKPPPSDLMVIAGDIAVDRGQGKWFLDKFMPWCKDYMNPIYATFGNHDRTEDPTIRELLNQNAPPNLEFLVDQSRLIAGKRFYFTPWSPRYGDWAWMKSDFDLDGVYEKIPWNTQILVSHSPPRGYCDINMQYERCGSQALLARIDQLPLLEKVICGHIHEGKGSFTSVEKWTVHNVSAVDEYYNLYSDPWTILDIRVEEQPYEVDSDPGDEDGYGHGV